MRDVVIFGAILLSGGWMFAQTSDAAPVEVPDSAYVEYQIRICTMIGNQVIRDAHGHLERLNGGEAHYEFRLDAQGRVSGLRIQSTLRDHWAEKDVERVIHALKFPPVPARVFRDLHSNQRVQISGFVGQY
jgi:hypothetical protein